MKAEEGNKHTPCCFRDTSSIAEVDNEEVPEQGDVEAGVDRIGKEEEANLERGLRVSERVCYKVS